MRGWPGLLLLAVAAPASGQDAGTALQAAERSYQQLRTLRAEFTQTIDNPVFGDPDTSRGVLFLSPPSGFAMRFHDPAGDRIVADGTWLWLFTPSSIPDQVIRSPIPESGPATPNLFAQFVERPLERYDASHTGSDRVGGVLVDKVKLVPRVEGLPFREAVLYVARSDGMLRALSFVEETGQRRLLTFDAIDVNVPIDAGELQFTPPPGVRIVTP